MKKLFDGKVARVCIDQHGNAIYNCKTLKELKDRVGGKRVEKIYIDKKDGGRVWIGYVIKGRWFGVYQALEVNV